LRLRRPDLLRLLGKSIYHLHPADLYDDVDDAAVALRLEPGAPR
jgi:hypothetical protein